ncbi:PIGR protein, partial [Eurystomus gularis]|nr:PIGR protein [Eurystomus gularis]
PVSSTLYGSRFLAGEVGGSVTHQCFYSTTSANKHDRKYWCKIVASRGCSTIISTTGYTSKDYRGRVSLEDIPQKGTFMVTMRELKKSDRGTYRCGIGSTNSDLYVSLNLTVSADTGVLGPIEIVRGELRGSVMVLCPPGDTQSSKRRFWCKLGRTGCTLIADTDGYVGKSYQGRISITTQESSGAFKILINDLKKEDSGLYRCGTGRFSSQDSPRVVALQVTTASTLPKRTKFLSGTVGGSLSVKCHYDPKGNYKKKYWCRWKGAACSLLVDADGFVHESYEGRIQIASSDQDSGSYTVVMSHLREEDAGWYWCGAENRHTEHKSSVKLLIQKETCSSQDPETSTLVKSTFSSPATSSTATQRSITGLTYTAGTVTERTSTLLPTASPGTFETSPGTFETSPGTFETSPGTFETSPGTFETSPGETYSKSSSGEPRLLPVVLSALILLIFITITVLILTKIKLQKETGGERSAVGNLEAAEIQDGGNPVKEPTMEEAPSPDKAHERGTDPGKHRWVFSGAGTASVVSL